MQEADVQTKEKLRQHIELAKTLGAKIVTVFGEDVGRQIAEYALVGNVSKVVIGRTNHRFFLERPGSEILEKLSVLAPNTDVYVIPDMKAEQRTTKKVMFCKPKNGWKTVLLDLAEITAVMAVTTVAAHGMQMWNLSESNIIMIYILGVLLSSYIADNRLYALYSSLLGVLSFNFFFTEPYLSLKAYDRGYPTTFLMLFIVGLFTANMTRKLKVQNKENAKKAYRTEILLENSQKLRRCKSEAEVWEQVASQSEKLLDLSVIVYPIAKNGLPQKPLLFPRQGAEKKDLLQYVNPQEKAVVQWVIANRHRAGACTHTLPTAKAMYLPIQDEEEVKGVMGVVLEERREIQEFKYGLLIAMLNETGVKLQDKFLE